ncbi:MAG: Ty1/Copia family ribonuclease HI, partial [Acinetobacter sp.]|nr:Ty1/Copia family ribonuclease HI [Acinetobacter sp.]
LAGGTRPDLAFATTYMSQFNSCPSKEHWASVQHILRYLKQTKNLKLTFQKTGKNLEVYCDSDWASDKIDRRSFSGYVVLLAGGAVSWSSKKQRTTALSTVEAEYFSMCHAAKEVLWFQNFLQEIVNEQFLSFPQNVHVDNQGAISLAKNHVTSERNKHIELRHFFLREKVDEKLLTFTYVPSESNIADMFTKSVQRKSLCNQKLSIGLREI